MHKKGSSKLKSRRENDRLKQPPLQGQPFENISLTVLVLGHASVFLRAKFL